MRSCSSASWARARPAPRARSRPSWASSRSTPTASSSASWGRRSRPSSTARARPPSASARRRRCCGCWSAPPGPVLALGGGALGSERVREALGAHTVVHLEVTPDDAWHRASGRGRPLARDRVRFDQLHADRAAVYAAAAHATLPPSGRDAVRRALPALLALAAAPAGTRMVWASSESGEYPVFLGRGLLAAGFLFPDDGRRFVVSDEHVARHHVVDGEQRILIVPGEEHKTIHGAEFVLRRLAQAGAERGDLVVAVGGGVVGDLAGFCAADLPARDAPRAGADDARGPGRLRLRRQDRRRPARGQELRRRLPPARGGDLRSGGARHAAVRGAGRRLRRGRQDGADRRRAAVGAGAPGRRRSTRRSSSAACARSSRRSPRTSATAVGARC